MPRPILNARLHLLALMLVWAAWMATTGFVLGLPLANAERVSDLTSDQLASAGVTMLLTALAWVLLNARLPELTRWGNVWSASWIAFTGFLGLAGLWLGAYSADWQVANDTEAFPMPGVLWARGAFGILGLCLVFMAPSGAAAASRFFLLSRHASDEIARRSLLAAAGQALLAAMAATQALHVATPETRLLISLLQAGAAYYFGAMTGLAQRYHQRAMALIPIGWTLAAMAILCTWIWPDARVPLILFGFALGLGHAAPRNDLLANVVPSQRALGLGLMAVAMALGAAGGFAISSMPPPVRFLVAVLLAAVAVYGYLRELIEQVVELILAITNPLKAYGPGLKKVPMRGPVLVLANHCAWFDPLWIAKVMPLRFRPMMTSKFYDLPCISWLMRRVFHTIRVPEVAFRREAPEIQEAIAALDRGENVLIFPEGWLKRKEEQSLRRFGQGIYQILRDKPRTPVVACWIEGSWGSYTSYKGGPPTKNKKFDIFRRIRIAISEPQVLPLDMLHDHWQTRRHLMLAVLHARTYLGLPELPPPPFAAEENGDEGEGSAKNGE